MALAWRRWLWLGAVRQPLDKSGIDFVMLKVINKLPLE